MSKNTGQIHGTLPRAPKAFTGKQTVARFTVEVPRGDETKSRDYIDVVAFGKNADDILRWGTAGTEVAVTTTIQSNRFERDGKMVYTQDVVATHIATTAGAKTVAEQAADEEDSSLLKALDDALAAEEAPVAEAAPDKPKRKRAAKKA
jgi:single-stranded DNA-binding protein